MTSFEKIVKEIERETGPLAKTWRCIDCNQLLYLFFV